MKIAQKLHQIQKHTGKTQEELARDLDVSFPTLNSWINENSQPRESSVKKIDALYLKIFGDTSIKNDEIDKKINKLIQLKQQFPDPFSLIMSRQDLYDELLLSLTYHTNSIEGSTFKEPDVRAVLFEDVTIPNKSVREHQEVKNHQAALGFVMRWSKNDNRKIDESFIKHIHQILLNGIMHNAGIYRNHSVRIAGANVPTSNFLSIDKHMDELATLLNQTQEKLVHQLEHLAKTHSRFEQIHPFSDGNGRVGRLLMLTLAIKFNLAPVLIKQEKKQAYYTYLKESQTKNNHIPLTSFILDAVFEGYELVGG